MADNTISFKITDGNREKLKYMVEGSGLTAKDWLENALALYEVKTMQSTSSEFSQNLSELELHTTRIFELTVNMIKQATYIKDDAVRKIAESDERKTLRIEELEDERKRTNVLLNESIEQNQLLKKEIEDYIETIEEGRMTVANNQALIDEYKGKNDTLNGLLTKYQKYEEINEELQGELLELQDKLTAQIDEHKTAYEAQVKKTEGLIASSNKKLEVAEVELKELVSNHNLTVTELEKDNKLAIANLEKQIQEQAEQHERDVTFINEQHSHAIELIHQQHENAIERTKLKVQADYQEKLQIEIDKIRASYDERLKEFLNPAKPSVEE